MQEPIFAAAMPYSARPLRFRAYIAAERLRRRPSPCHELDFAMTFIYTLRPLGQRLRQRAGPAAKAPPI